MESEENLPIIVVSAADAAAADKFISELIGEEEEAGARAADDLRVWRLHNKYYRARVALLVRPDGDLRPPPPPPADAHLVLLADHECSSGATLRRRASALSGAGGARVRLALAAGAGPWVQAARAARYEPVPLRPPPEGNSEDSEDEASAGPRGLDRVREALHAHAWRSLRLHGDARPPPRLAGSSSDTDRSGSSEGEEEDSEWSGWQSASQTERVASQFAAALGVLSERCAAGEGEARLVAAEALLAALRPPPRHPPP